MEEKDKNVIFDLGPEIRESLNISTLPQFLFKHRLATAPEERELLLNPLISPTEKKDKLLYLWLLQKGDDSLGRFVKALRESAQEEPTHEEIARKIEAKRAQNAAEYTNSYFSNTDDDHRKTDSGIDIPGKQHPKTPPDQSNTPHHTSTYKSPVGNLPTMNDDDAGQWEPVSSGTDSEEECYGVLQKEYSKVMGPEGVAKLVDKIAVGELRLFYFNITRTAEDYSRMSSGCFRSNDVWCRVSINCNVRYFDPLEMICQHFSTGNEVKLIKEYKDILTKKEYESVLQKIKPNEGYQSIIETKKVFASCIVNIANSLADQITGKKIRLEDMKSYFCTLKIFSADHEQELLITKRKVQDNITKAKDVFFLLFAISPCWDYINFLYLEEHVVKQFGGSEEKHELQRYKDHLKNLWLKEYCPDMTQELTCSESCSQVECKINADWDTAKIQQILRLKQVIASIYNIDPSAVKLLKAKKGSIIVYFVLPSPCITEISDEKVVVLAKHNFLELTVYDKPGEINTTLSCNITEKFAALDNLFQVQTNEPSSDYELCSDVLLVEKLIKNKTAPMLSQHKKIFKHQANYHIVLQIFTTSSKLNIYHTASSNTDGKGLLDYRILYGIDVRMKSNKGKPCALEITLQNSILTIVFSTQAEMQQWFIALKRIIGFFHLRLKIFPSNLSIPDNLVVHVEGDTMTFWSAVDDRKCMEWKLHDLTSVSLKNALYICVKSNAVLKEDMYVFEGQQLETLFDLLEEYKSALCNNSECENSLTSSYTEQEDGQDNSKPSYSAHPKIHKSDKKMERTHSVSSFGESDSLTNVSSNDYGILNEILNAEPVSTAYHAFSWKVKEEKQLQDKSIQLIKATWYDVVSKYILNRGYRITVTMPDQQTRILAEEKNNPEGKKQIQHRWRTIVQAIDDRYKIFQQPTCTKEVGHFQTASLVMKASECICDLDMPHFQNVYYGSIKPTKMMEGSLATGMAQCTIPPEQLKEMYSNLSNNNLWLKLWPSSAPHSNISVNYMNEIEHRQFKETIYDPESHSTSSEILLYIPRSSKSFIENLTQTSQLAVDLGFSGKVVVFDWCTEKCTTNIDQLVEETKPQLLQFIEMLYLHSNKIHIVAVYDAALLVIKILSSVMNFRLGQVVFTRLASSLSSRIFEGLQKTAPFNADNVTIYHQPKSCTKSLMPIRSFTFGSTGDVFSKKEMLEPPPFINGVDIICLGKHPNSSLIKNREYAVNKVIIEDMSEIICFRKGVTERSSRVRIQCGCRELKLPRICRSRLKCTFCNCNSYFVLGCVIGLGNFTPSLLDEMQQSQLQKHEKGTKKLIKCSSVSANIRA